MFASALPLQPRSEQLGSFSFFFSGWSFEGAIRKVEGTGPGTEAAFIFLGLTVSSPLSTYSFSIWPFTVLYLFRPGASLLSTQKYPALLSDPSYTLSHSYRVKFIHRGVLDATLKFSSSVQAGVD